MGSLDAKTAKLMADVTNGLIAGGNDPIVIAYARDLMIRIMSHATAGRYEFLYQTSNPLPSTLIEAFGLAGYTIVLQGFTYRISWRDA